MDAEGDQGEAVDAKGTKTPEPVMSQELVNLRDEILREKQKWEQNVEDQDSELSPSEAEKAFQKENKRCSKKNGKCVPTDHNDDGTNPYNPFVRLCEHYAMPNDFGSSVCRVSEPWMLTGEPDKQVAWWAGVLMELINAKVDKVQEHCLKAPFKDWLIGKCKRRFVQISRAMGIVSKAVLQKNYTAAVKLSEAKVQELQTNLTAVQGRLKFMLFSMISKDDQRKLIKRFFAAIENMDLRKVQKNISATQELITRITSSVSAQDNSQAETLIKQLEDQATAGSNQKSVSIPRDEAKNFKLDHVLDGAMNMVIEKVESVQSELEVEAFTDDSLLETKSAASFSEVRDSIKATRALKWRKTASRWLSNALYGVHQAALITGGIVGVMIACVMALAAVLAVLVVVGSWGYMFYLIFATALR